MYSYLAFAVFVALLIDQCRSRSFSLACGLFVGLILLPDLPYTVATGVSLDIPFFFLNGEYQSSISGHDIVLALPFAQHGNSMIWQAKTGMYFRLAAAWTGSLPREFDAIHAYELFGDDGLTPMNTDRVRSFMSKQRVTIVVVPERQRSSTLDRILSVEPRAVGGMLLYRVSTVEGFARHEDIPKTAEHGISEPIWRASEEMLRVASLSRGAKPPLEWESSLQIRGRGLRWGGESGAVARLEAGTAWRQTSNPRHPASGRARLHGESDQ